MIDHLLALYRAGQLRFRAETFGLYFPSLPGRRPWWRVAIGSLLFMIRASRSYAHWTDEMNTVARGGPHGWWGREWPAIDLEGELALFSKEDPQPS